MNQSFGAAGPYRLVNYFPVAMSSVQSTTCLNCGHALQPDHRFCPACGQATHLHRINGHYLAHEAVHYFTHADRGIFLLLASLLRQPGIAARHYLAGQRKKYFPPLTFFLLGAAILVFMSKWIGNPGGEALQNIQAALQNPGLSAAEKQQLLVARRSMQAADFTAQYANFVNMLATPILVMWMYLFYRRQRLNFTEHLVANLYFVGFTSLGYSLLFVPVFHAIKQGSSVYAIILFLYFVFEIGYRSISYYQLFPELKGKGGGWRCVLASLCSTLFWFLLSFTAITLYVLYGG